MAYKLRALVAVSVGHPLAGVGAGLPQRRLSWYMLWFLFPGVAERILPADDWAFFRCWAWDGAEPGQAPTSTARSLTSPAPVPSKPASMGTGLRPDQLNRLLLEFLGIT